MVKQIVDAKLKSLVAQGKFDDLFIDELTWDNPEALPTTPISLTQRDPAANPLDFVLEPVAHKRGVAVFSCDAGATMIPKEIRRRIARELQRTAHEHLIIFHTSDFQSQVWFWPYREHGKPARPREIEFTAGFNAARLLNLLKDITFDFASEGTLVLTDVTAALNKGASPDKVTKKFYDEFSKQRSAFHDFIAGISDCDDRNWYAALMLNRLMFTWFLQSKGFLDGDRNYLTHRLAMIERGEIPNLSFHDFYRGFLRTLFHDAFSTPEDSRLESVRAQLGDIPYINGGIFEQHRLELENNDIQIPDEAFRRLFDFFGQYTWHLDDRPLGNEKEINPDVLGYIFEKFVNQKEKGAYYTKEDVTGYISQNTILPWILDQARTNCRVAFDPAQPNNAWRLLQETPEKYIYRAMKHGVIDEFNALLPLPEPLRAGENHYAQRSNWNQRATELYALPTETWREYFHRRRRTLELREKLANGEIHEVDDLITWNLDIRQFTQDIVENVGGNDLVRAMWKAVSRITVLDPTVGSGAFLFAAVRVLEPVYSGLLDRMEQAVLSDPGAKTNDFAATLTEGNLHPNRAYYVLRQIILNNLYGVDIEEEAVEICKLRLFLLLAATLEEGKTIEPLPDIDFNIRAGNTLVGYATREEVQKATSSGQLALDLGGGIDRIDLAARLADQAFQHFKETQSEPEFRADLPAAKAQYRARIGELRDELDGYLYGQQRSKDSRSSWKDRTHPFHWFAEFHSIVIDNGGFDVIIGNPPYVRASDVRKQYALNGFKTEKAPDIYAMVMERSVNLLTECGRSGMIVPLSLTFSGDFETLRKLLAGSYKVNWFSSFGRIPSALFSHDVRIRNTIQVSKRGQQSPKALSTRLHRWNQQSRSSLFDNLDFGVFEWGTFDWLVPRFNSGRLSQRLVQADRRWKSRLSLIATNSKTHWAVHYPKTAYNWTTFTPFQAPSFDLQGNPIPQTKWGTFYVSSRSEQSIVCLLLSGSIGFTYWSGLGDDFDVTKGQMLSLSFPTLDQSEQNSIMGIMAEFEDSLQSKVNFKLNAGKRIGRFDIIKIRDVTDRSDRILAPLMDIRDEEWEEILLLSAQMVKTDGYESEAE